MDGKGDRRRGGEGMTLFGVCGLLAEEANLLARVQVDTLPDDFVPGYSLDDTVVKIRQQHTNYEELVDELDLRCTERAAAVAKCPFSRNLTSGTARQRCPYLAILCRGLVSTADERAQEAFAQWRQRKNGERRDN
jgi:hypothetical protein